MTAINTNTASLNAQYFLAKANKEMESSMAKLSSGQKVNSAADDAAGLAIAGRMTSQIKGLNMAIKNANDTVALAQTAESAMEEVTNMLQRMRELAVQASNGTMNDSDRASLDSEVQALKTEIDRVSGTTQFNNQNLLDGTFSKTFQIGDKSGQTVDLAIDSVSTKKLGLGATVGATSITGTRVGGTAAALGTTIAAGDVKINGQDVGAIATSDDMEAILKAINDNVDNVVATAHNTVVAKVKGDGVTADNDFTIAVTEYGASTATTYTISASGSMKELVANINRETGGVVAASINNEGKLVLSNNSGVGITVNDGSASAADAFDGGTGFSGDSADLFKGFITLSSTDGSAITVERGNLGNTSPGTEAMLAALGYRETTSETVNDKYTVTGAAMSDITTAWGTTDLIINDVAIYDSSIASDTYQGRVDAINHFSTETGVVASLFYETLIDTTNMFASVKTTGTAGSAGQIAAADIISINGFTDSAMVVGVTAAAMVTNINNHTDDHGLTAKLHGANVVLSGSNMSQARVEVLKADGTADGISGDTAEAVLQTATENVRLRLDSVNDTPIRIELGDGHTVAEHGFLEANVGAADFDVNAPMMNADGVGNVRGLSIATTGGASSAMTAIDKAIDMINGSRSDLGALQNRLDHTVNNLSSVTNATESAKGRIVDTDFASETAKLTKQQILSQAATSMLAQANQSKQGILALLQG